MEWVCFYCIGEAKCHEDWYFSSWLVETANTSVSWQSEQDQIIVVVGFWSSLLQILLTFGCRRLISVQCLLHVCTPEPCSLLAVYKDKRENSQVLTLPRFPDQNWEGRGNSLGILVSVHLKTLYMQHSQHEALRKSIEWFPGKILLWYNTENSFCCKNGKKKGDKMCELKRKRDWNKVTSQVLKMDLLL